MSDKLSCNRCGKIHINEDILTEQLVYYLWSTTTDDQLFKIANILLGTNYSPATHCFSDGEVCSNDPDLDIIKTIWSSENLTKKEKQDIIERILRIYKSSDELEECVFTDSKKLSTAFIWRGTEEGHDYWSFIDRRLYTI